MFIAQLTVDQGVDRSCTPDAPPSWYSERLSLWHEAESLRVRADREAHRGMMAIILLLIAYGFLHPFSIVPGAGSADPWLRFFSLRGAQHSISVFRLPAAP